MSKPYVDQSRRRVLRAAATTALFLPIASIGLRSASGTELQPLSEDDATAKALAYHVDAAAVDAASFPEFKPDRLCSNCAVYQGDSATGGCSIFPGKSVAAGGWCKAWVQRT